VLRGRELEIGFAGLWITGKRLQFTKDDCEQAGSSRKPWPTISEPGLFALRGLFHWGPITA
jgi:hypothetical protein